MTNIIQDDYISKVMGKSRKELISIDEKDENGKIVEKADIAANLAKLEEEADRLARLAAEQSSCAALSSTCTKLIGDSRKKLSESNFNADTILDNFDAVKRRLIQAYESRRLWPKLFLCLLLYNIFLIAVFAVIIVWKSLIPANSGASGDMAVGILACAIWGGLGGVVDALVALNLHFTSQDFDRQYSTWYYIHPLLGTSLGAIIYLVLQAGLATISNSNTATGSSTGTIQVGITAFSIAIAFLAGFKQTSALEFLSRIVKSIFQKENSSDQKSA